jgi:hypothetical protein
MTTDAPWHAGPELLQAYADGRLDPVGQAAVETHVDRCADCRDAARAVVAPAALAPVWDGVLTEVRTPTQPRPLRLLARLGVPEVDLVVLRASGNLLLALGISAAAALVFALTAVQLSERGQQLAWLVVAPLMPAILVAAAYDSTDPLRELADPTPYSKLRVALLRTAVALVGSIPLVGVMTVVPDLDASLATWLLPALTISLVLLVLLTRLSAVTAVTFVAGGWVAAVLALRSGDDLQVVNQPVGQYLSLCLAVLAAVVLAHRLGVLLPARSRR